MWTPRLHHLVLPLSLLAFSAGCSTESGSKPAEGSFYVVSCTLGCTDGVTGNEVNCSISNTYQNQEISIVFSEPIDLFSANSSSFRITDVANGTTPSGQFFSDPTDARRMIFRPSLTFDQNGTPIHGFASATSYRIFLPGTQQSDTGPFLQSTAGVDNKTRMQCTIKTTEGVIDPVPGDPSVQIFVDQVVDYDTNGDPIIVSDVLMNTGTELFDVYRQTQLRFEFDDVMNVATLLDPSTGQSPNIDIEVDEDGDLTTADRTAIGGTFTFGVDLAQLTTTLYFVADAPLPSAGPNAPSNPRRIVVTLPPAVQDLVANSISTGGGAHSFVTELPLLGEVVVPDGGEDFQLSWPDPNSHEDGIRSGALWGGGRLSPGIGGGSGRLGDLIIPSGATVVLNTDLQTFPLTMADGLPTNLLPDIIGNPDPVGFPGTIGNFPTSATVTDGVFEFDSLSIGAGSILRIEGTNPARIYARGTATVNAGTILDLSGVQPLDHDSEVENPDTDLVAPTGPAGAGDGGFGGDRFDMAINTGMTVLSLCESSVISNPGADTAGRPGQGVGRAAGVGGGGGGVQYPTNYPTVDTTTTVGNNNHGLGFNFDTSFSPIGSSECRSLMVGGSGSGGAYALDGGVGTSASVTAFSDFPEGQDNGAPDTAGGLASQVGLELPDDVNTGYTQRLLNWWDGNLRGGSGGGGGGNHPHGAVTWRPSGGGTACIGTNAFFRAWHDHSGAMGGSGGGALQLTAGKRLTVDGQIRLNGGQGGQARGDTGPTACTGDSSKVDFGQFATPGGGGSGGSLKLQSIVVDIAPTAGTIDVSGGLGGQGVWSLAQGGVGSPGLVRIEDVAGIIDRSLVAPSILPYDPTDESMSWVSVDSGQDPLDGPGWIPSAFRPDSISASVSCWLAPSGVFFALAFVDDDDDDNTGDPDDMGWNMDVIYTASGSEVLVPFRGANGIFAGSFENQFGKSLGTQGGTVQAAPVVVRFQGARLDGSGDPCNGDINDFSSGIDPTSVTPWVDHPALLNDFAVAPNVVRFVVIYDGTVQGVDTPGDVLVDVAGVTNLRMRAIPD